MTGTATLTLSLDSLAVSKISEAASGSPIETGGVLSGLLLDEEVAVENVFTPPDSLGDADYFIRGKEGLEGFFMEEWEKGRVWVGEWHSHPVWSLTPSADDIAEMRKLIEAADIEGAVLLIASTNPDTLRLDLGGYMITAEAVERVDIEYAGE
jgi:proteasome lid subunit RPN8/RPN11